MNQSTLEKLDENPHYKLSAKQKEELEKKKKPMISFGVPPIHNQTIPKHETLTRKKA